MKDSSRFLVTCEYRIRSLLIKGAARRTLNASRNSSLAYAQPSIAALISHLVEIKLNVPPLLVADKPPTKKILLMMFLHARIHEAISEESKLRRISATQLVSDIIIEADLKHLDLNYSNELQNMPMIPNSFNLPSECRLKINREIARRMISQPTALGKGEYENVGKIINEILAAHLKISLPANQPSEIVVDNEQIKFTVFMDKILRKDLQVYCKEMSAINGRFTSANATIIKWIEETAEDEMW